MLVLHIQLREVLRSIGANRSIQLRNSKVKLISIHFLLGVAHDQNISADED